MGRKDWISLIEASYDLDGTDESWMRRVLDRAVPMFDRGIVPTIAIYRFTPTTLEFEHIAVKGPRIFRHFLRAGAHSSREAVDLVYRSGRSFGTMSDVVFSRHPEQRAVMRTITGGLLKDIIALVGHSGMGRAVMMGVSFTESITPTRQERERWPLVASHLGAGMRLRSIASVLALDGEAVEAVLDPSGKVQDARGCAAAVGVRQSLRDAVRRIERARSLAGRSDPDAAMQTWQALMMGRWSLVDRFDTDGRRFVVAVKNDPSYPDPRGLTSKERQVAEFTGLGRSTKEVAYTLGVSSSAVTNCTARAQEKLGLKSRTELAAFFAPNGIRARLAEVALDGERLLVGAYPLIDEVSTAKLTGAERSVAALVLAGSTNRDIAHRRETSESTVANQVQSIFQKLGARSRGELAARLQAARI